MSQTSETAAVPSSGFYWHVHHGILLEWCHSYEERADYIRKAKPPHERALRLRLFQPVRGDLPHEVVEAWRAYDEAGRAYGEAVRAHVEALNTHKDAIEALHARECPDCPWDGTTIFPEPKYK